MYYVLLSTDSYKDAQDYIAILNKIQSQERDSVMNDSIQTPIICNVESNRNMTEVELKPLSNADVKNSKDDSNAAETDDNINKRYFTRQFRKMYSTDKLTQAISDISLNRSSKKTHVESNTSINEDTSAKEGESAVLIENNNQMSQKASLRHEFINEQLVECIKAVERVSSITELALEEHNVLKRLEDITISIKKSINGNGTEEPSKIKIPVFGEDFIDLMQKLYSRFDQCQAMLLNAHKQYIDNCLTVKKIISLVNALNAMNVDSNHGVEKEAAIIVEEKTDKNVEVICDTESGTEEQPHGAQIQSIINTVVQKSFDISDKNIDDQEIKESNEIRFEPPKFTLPPEYDPNNSRWSLKYSEIQNGVEEFVKNSGIYINSIGLANCIRVARDSKTLARMLMLEIFSENALKTCSLTGKRANAFYSRDDGNVRPGLDQHARMVLMNYVDDHAKKNHWPSTSNQAIVDSMRNKLQEIRVKSALRKKK